MSYDAVSSTSTRKSWVTVGAVVVVQHLVAKLFFGICFNSVQVSQNGGGDINDWHPTQSLNWTEMCIDVTKDNWYKSSFEDKQNTACKSKNTNHSGNEMTCHGDAKTVPSSLTIRGAYKLNEGWV